MNDTNSNTVTTSNEQHAPYAVAATERGTSSGRVTSEWYSRPDDQRFLDLDTLEQFTRKAASESRANNIDVRGIRVAASKEDADTLKLIIPEATGRGEVVQTETQPNHWSFSQLCQLTGVPAGYLRRLPAPIAAINLQYATKNFREEVVKAYVRENGRTELRAATGPNYGRIHDYEVVAAVRRIAGNGNGDTHWKVPGVMNWGDGTYNPHVDITKETTTLFASDRDVFLFLVDDTHPIEVGTFMRNGVALPDLMFRGFYVWNSEVGSKSFGVAAFYLRGICQNRCLWGVENFNEVTFRHSSGAPSRFMHEIRPALESFADRRTSDLIAGVNAAKAATVARDDEQRREFLSRRGFTGTQCTSIIDTVLEEEGHAAESVWDFVQGITAVARKEGRQDERLDLERKAGKLLDAVKA
jgi:hypothetical protein